MEALTPSPEILLLDSWLAVAAKPAGLLTHPSPLSPGEPSCMTALRGSLRSWVYPVHRLDRATSGVLAFGRTSESASRLGEAVREGRFIKTYLAIVRGKLEGEGVIDRALANHEDVEGEGEGAGGKTASDDRCAVTKWRSLGVVEMPWAVRPFPTARYSLLELTPETGRTHQLRRHLRGISHPIVGDTRYGDGAHNRAFAAETGVGRLLLHAARLGFPHPETGTWTEVEAPLDGGFARALELFSGSTGAAPLD